MDGGCHLKIERHHHLIGHLDDGDVVAEMVHIFCHFQADETCAHDGHVMDVMLVYKRFDLIGIMHVSQGENTLVVDARDGRSERFRAGRQDKLVVAFGVGAAIPARDGDFFGLAVDRSNFFLHTHIHVEFGRKAFGCFHKEALTI